MVMVRMMMMMTVVEVMVLRVTTILIINSGPYFQARRLNNYSRLTFEQLNILHQSFQFICAELQPRKTSKIFSVSLIPICRLQLSMDVGIGSNNLSHHIFTCFFLGIQVR